MWWAEDPITLLGNCYCHTVVQKSFYFILQLFNLTFLYIYTKEIDQANYLLK